ncbi:hypothetical protein ACFVR2_22955 [Gottfriedia sp. NPDC057991]|uniref:hypothetical protein n=1 Tax=Gottfriedia sp. NPDC057991 TaxID=3346298 RepID=UPI0036D8CF83
MKKADFLIKILLDLNCSDAERDDAAIELGYIYNDEFVEDALLQIANNQNTDEMIRASCGESLAQIWLSRKVFEYNKLSSLKGIAFSEAMGLIKREDRNIYEDIKKKFNI